MRPPHHRGGGGPSLRCIGLAAMIGAAVGCLGVHMYIQTVDFYRQQVRAERRTTEQAEARVLRLSKNAERLSQELQAAKRRAATAERQLSDVDRKSEVDDTQPPEPAGDDSAEHHRGSSEQVPPYTVRVVVFTYNRLEGLKRLWRSLVKADYLGHRVSCDVFFDAPKPDHGPMDGTAAWLRGSAKWPHGPLRVHRRERNAGLKVNIMEAWYPVESENTTFTAFFEDDIEVSPLWYRWTDSAVHEYALSGRADRKMLGVSLYRPIHDELTSRRMTKMLDNGNRPFGLQQPCSWGAVYFPEPWRKFRDWYRASGGESWNPMTKGPGLPYISSNSWSHRSSWKKYLIKFMYDMGMFMVYPNPPNRMVFSTNHLMKGEHPTPNRELFELPLLTQSAFESDEGVLEAPPLSRIEHYDVACRRVEGVDGYPNHARPYPPP